MIDAENISSPIEITEAILGLVSVWHNNRNDACQYATVENDYDGHAFYQGLPLAGSEDLSLRVAFFRSSGLHLPLHSLLVQMGSQRR